MNLIRKNRFQAFSGDEFPDKLMLTGLPVINIMLSEFRYKQHGNKIMLSKS